MFIEIDGTQINLDHVKEVRRFSPGAILSRAPYFKG